MKKTIICNHNWEIKKGSWNEKQICTKCGKQMVFNNKISNPCKEGYHRWSYNINNKQNHYCTCLKCGKIRSTKQQKCEIRIGEYKITSLSPMKVEVM